MKDKITQTDGVVFKVNVASYQIIDDGVWYYLHVIRDGKPHNKCDLRTTDLDRVFRYLADAEYCSVERVREQYENN